MSWYTNFDKVADVYLILSRWTDKYTPATFIVVWIKIIRLGFILKILQIRRIRNLIYIPYIYYSYECSSCNDCCIFSPTDHSIKKMFFAVIDWDFFRECWTCRKNGYFIGTYFFHSARSVTRNLISAERSNSFNAYKSTVPFFGSSNAIQIGFCERLI